MSDGRGPITRLLQRHRAGDDAAFQELIPLVYEHLRRIARRQRRGPGGAATLDTTSLVHEAYLQMVDERGVDWQDRAHFFAISARAMRRIVVDYARRRGARKRGGGVPHLPLDAARHGAAEQAEAILAIDEALETLTTFNPRLARLVECRFFAGMSEEETARALDTSLRTVQRDWMRARAWLRKQLQSVA